MNWNEYVDMKVIEQIEKGRRTRHMIATKTVIDAALIGASLARMQRRGWIEAPVIASADVVGFVAVKVVAHPPRQWNVCAHYRDRSILREMLLMVSFKVGMRTIRAWTMHEVLIASDWAARSMLQASDNVIRVPQRPSFILDQFRI